MHDIVDRARKALDEAPSSIETGDAAVSKDTGLSVEDMTEEAAEEDLENQVLADEGLGSNQNPVPAQADEKDFINNPDIEPEVPYADAARTSMDDILQGSMSKHKDYKKNPVHCPLCEQDETILQKFKDKKWNRPSKLAAHMETPLHTPKGLWERQTEALAAQRGDGRYKCAYCKEIGIDEDECHFANLRALFVHIENDTKFSRPDAKEELQMHKELKGRDGWGEPGWAENQGDIRKRIVKESRDYIIKRDLRPLDRKYSDLKELPVGIPHPTIPGVVLGGPSREFTPHPAIIATPFDIDDRSFVFPQSQDPIPSHLQHIIETIPFDQVAEIPLAPIPEAHKHLIEFDPNMPSVNLTEERRRQREFNRWKAEREESERRKTERKLRKRQARRQGRSRHEAGEDGGDDEDDDEMDVDEEK